MTNEMHIPDDYLYVLVASPDFSNDGTLFAGRSSGLYRSTDQGKTWTLTYESMGLETALPTTAVVLSPNFPDDQTVFAAVEGNVLRSNNGGDTWQYAKLFEPMPLVSALCIAPDFSRDGLLLAGTLDDGVIRSTNRSITWQRWNFGLLDPHIYAMKFVQDGSILAGVESGIFRSTNGGRAWREVDFPMDLAPVISLGVSGDSILAGTEENGLYISKDGGDSWEHLAPDTIQGSVIQIHANESGVLVVLEDGIYFSRDDGNSWDARTGFDPGVVISSVAAPLGLRPGTSLWVGFANGEIVKI